MIGIYILIGCALCGVPLTLFFAKRDRWLYTCLTWYYAEACAASATGGAFHYGSVGLGIAMFIATVLGIIGIFAVMIHHICKPRPLGRGFLFDHVGFSATGHLLQY